MPDGIPRAAADAAGDSMEDAVTAARDLPAGPADDLLTAAAEAYTRGLNTIGVACAVIAAISATIALTMLRRSRGAVPTGDRAPAART
ncbi:hypothetical protein [Streptomyces niveus]